MVILDTTGRGAAILDKTNVGDLHHRPLIWYDLANRQRPVAFFKLGLSEHIHEIAGRCLRLLSDLSHVKVTDATISWAGQALKRLCKDGLVGLAAILRNFFRPEFRRWFLDTQRDPTEYERLMEMLAWALRYPSVYCLSEGSNPSSLVTDLDRGATIWIEAHGEHLEAIEQRLVAGLVEIALEDAVRRGLAHEGAPALRSVPTILYLFPWFGEGAEVPSWIKQTASVVRHVSVHQLYADRPLKPMAQAWARIASEVWILGGLEKIQGSAHQDWLNGTEVQQIRALHPEQLWIRDNGSRQALVASVGSLQPSVPLAHLFRVSASKCRNPLPVSQIASVAASIVESHPANSGLYSKLCDRETLRNAWFHVAAGSKESHGIDKVTVGMFEESLEEELEKLLNELITRQYQCRPLRRIYLSKSDGGKRPIGIPCVRDRIVETSLLHVLEPIFEPSFSHFSFAFRPRRNAHHALAVARSYIATGCDWAVTADIKKCFDNIDHEVLLDFLARKVGDPRILDLIHHMLTADVLDFTDLLPSEVGVPQGESLSPLLCNIYLDPLDKHLERLGIHFVRYADDMILLTRGEERARSALQVLEDFLRDPLRLEIKPAKTNFTPVTSGVDFLGFKLIADGILVQAERLDRAAEALGEQIHVLGDIQSSLLSRSNALLRINAIVRGFRNYFALPDEKRIEQQLHSLDGRIEQIAFRTLPPAIRDDPAWICRERFCLAQEEEVHAQPSVATGSNPPIREIYPEGAKHEAVPGWMVKTAEKGEAEKEVSKPVLLVEDPGDDEVSTTESSDHGVVQTSGRLYVLAHGSYLTVADDSLVIKKRKVEIRRTPIDELGLIFLQGYGMNISVNLQLKLAQRDIPVVFSPPVGQPIAMLNPVITSRSNLRGQQVLRRDDRDVIISGLKMLEAKAGNQAAVLRYFGKYRSKLDEALGSALTQAANDIRTLAAQIRALDPESVEVRQQAMGYEGHAAAIYWRHLIRLVPEEFGFRGRTTRAAPDPVNQCINYVYGMLYGEVWRAIVKFGLDPYFGLIHGSQRDGGSLVFDLIEEFRAPFADRLVFAMLGRGFHSDLNKDGLLKMRCRHQLATAFSKAWTKKIRWRSSLHTPAEILERQADNLVKLISREKQYQPFRMKW